jgi:fibronectin type 3 domain-containing protein
MQLFGYKTVITYPGQQLNQGGKVARVGDEVLSPYWLRSDTTLPVTIRQLGAYHSQTLAGAATVKWHMKGSTTTTNIFKHDAEEGQSFLPHIDNGVLGSVGANFARGTFTPTGTTFGFRVDNEWSDPTKNVQDQGGGGYGHHVRFFVAKDRNGKIIPDTYLMVMDYSGINYDYQDNVYLVSNIKPENAPGAPTGLVATPSGAGVSLTWNANTEANLAGYNVYRGTASGGPFTKLNTSDLLATAEFVDVTAPLNQQVWYIVKAVDNVGNESGNNAAVSATRTIDTAAPAIPKSFTATASSTGIQLNWADNTDSDFLGYNLYRSTSPDTGFQLLNTSGLLGSSTYFDSGAPTNVTSYYRVTAVDTSQNESNPATANAKRQTSDTTAPAKPTGLTAIGSTSGITLDWADTNTESDFLGYNVYRIENGSPVKLNTSGVLGVSQFIDTTAPAGVASSYEVKAIDTSNNESDAATASATRPADTTKPAAPSGIVVTANPSAITLDWANNVESDVVGYNVYRSTSVSGPWEKLNTSGLLTQSIYIDSTATVGQVSFYQITAVDASNNESDPGTASGTRHAPTPPSVVTGLTASVVAGGIQIDWADNTDSDLAGYNISRANSPDGTFTLLNTSGLLTSSAFLDTGAPSGTSYYRVTAVDDEGTESGPAQTSATRATSYTFTQIGSPTPGGSLTTIKDGSDYDMVAGGADIWNTADSFGFNYREVTGDFDMRVRVAGLDCGERVVEGGPDGARDPRFQQPQRLRADFGRQRPPRDGALDHRRDNLDHRQRRGDVPEQLDSPGSRRQCLHRLPQHGRHELDGDRLGDAGAAEHRLLRARIDQPQHRSDDNRAVPRSVGHWQHADR